MSSSSEAKPVQEKLAEASTSKAQPKTKPGLKGKILKNKTDPKAKTLEEVAVEELLKEAQRGSSRAEVGGALAWKKPPKVNHRLFKNTLAQVVVGNIRKDHSKPSGEPKRKH